MGGGVALPERRALGIHAHGRSDESRSYEERALAGRFAAICSSPEQSCGHT